MHDCIIIGAGIAGMVMSRVLHDAGYDIAIINNPRIASASQVAAGLMNPITGKRFELSWRYEEFLSIAREFYAECEKADYAGYYRPFPMLRIFADEKEHETFHKKYAPDHLGLYVGEQFSAHATEIHPSIRNHFGGFRTLNAGVFEYKQFLDEHAKKFSECMFEGIVDDQHLSRTNDMWTLHLEGRKFQARHVIFCDGWRGSMNPWFADADLKYDIVKGELCVIRSKELSETDIISRGFAIIPIGNHMFRCAATFQWNEFHTLPTAFGAERLHSRVQSLINCEYEILEQSAGLRPTMFDHKPFLGEHPRHPGLMIIGGLGTKGALYAPFMALNLLNYMQEGKMLDPEMDIASKFQYNETM